MSLCTQSSLWDLAYLVFGVMLITIALEAIVVVPTWYAIGDTHPAVPIVLSSIIGFFVPLYLTYRRIHNIKSDCSTICDDKIAHKFMAKHSADVI